MQREKKTISFELSDEVVKGDRRLMKVLAMIDGETKGTGVDFSKKRAEQIAAEETCKMLGILQ